MLRHPDGEPITNLYLFDADGEPVEDVFVHDGVGRPVEIGDLAEVGFEDLDTVYPRSADGTPLTNRYPLERYVIQYGESTPGEERVYIPDREPRTTADVVLPSSSGPGVTSEDDAEPSATPTPTPTRTPVATPSATDAPSVRDVPSGS